MSGVTNWTTTELFSVQLNQVELGKGYVSLLEGLYFDSAE